MSNSIVLTAMGLHCPTIPSFISIVNVQGSVDIADLPDDTLKALGKTWTEELIKKAKERRASKDSRTKSVY